MSESRFNRARLSPSSSDTQALGVQRDAHVFGSISSPSPPSALESFFEEPTVEFDARVLSSMLARSAHETLEVTRTYEIPADVLALARGDRTAPGGRTAAPARPGSPLVAPLAHVLVTAWAIALGYFLVQIIDG
jgi:hypothetical protein